MPLSTELRDYINAAFTGVWIQTQEADEAESDIRQLATVHKWRVAVWDVAQGLRVAGQPGSPEPGGDPLGPFSGTLDDLIAKANAVWEPQANVTFTKKLVTDPLPFKQEFGDVVRFSKHLPTTGPNAVPLSEHEWDIVVAKRDPGADFNVFFVWEYEQDDTPNVDNTAAGTVASQKSCIMEDSTNGPAELVFAHEAGHNLGLGHTGNAGELMFEGVLSNSSRKITRAQAERINP